MSETGIPEGFELVNISLREVEFLESTSRRKDYGGGHVVDFYAAAPDQYVKAYDAGGVVWAGVGGFSIHRGVEVVIINLSNGSQIITDHDPRAVFGVALGSKEVGRFYPDVALKLGVVVPCQIPCGVEGWGAGTLDETFPSLWGAVDRKAQLLGELGLGSRVAWDRKRELWALSPCDLEVSTLPPPHPELDGLQWVSIESVDYTQRPETGYDLTVPGYETFMSVDGVILSNTASIHVPSSKAAVKDVHEKMRPSQMLWSSKNRGTILHAPKHEQLIGLSMGYDKGGQKRKFKTDDEAMKAIEDGQIDLNDDIEIEP